MSAYTAIKKQVFPTMTAYTEDLTQHDRKVFRRHMKKHMLFFHGSRPTGTDLLIPERLGCKKEALCGIAFLLNSSNTTFYMGHTDSSTIEQIDKIQLIDRLRSYMLVVYLDWAEYEYKDVVDRPEKDKLVFKRVGQYRREIEPEIE